MKSKKQDNYKIPSFDEVKATTEDINNGLDPVTPDFDDIIVPEVINHVSYGVNTLTKPLLCLSDEAYAHDDIEVASYYTQLSRLIGNYNKEMFDQYTKYYINRYIYQVLQNIQQDIKNILDKNNIGYTKVELYNALYNFPLVAYNIFKNNLVIYELNVIEQMASIYVKDLNCENRDTLAITGMDMIKKIFSPHINAIVQSTVFELYNRVVSYIHNVLLYDIIVDDKEKVNLQTMNVIEKELNNTFAATIYFLTANYSNMVLTCFFSRTAQDPIED